MHRTLREDFADALDLELTAHLVPQLQGQAQRNQEAHADVDDVADVDAGVSVQGSLAGKDVAVGLARPALVAGEPWPVTRHLSQVFLVVLAHSSSPREAAAPFFTALVQCNRFSEPQSNALQPRWRQSQPSLKDLSPSEASRRRNGEPQAPKDVQKRLGEDSGSPASQSSRSAVPQAAYVSSKKRNLCSFLVPWAQGPDGKGKPRHTDGGHREA
eukprot:scaffold71_cov247-Pinguiococcus_pyrenoidosus.AAC.14